MNKTVKNLFCDKCGKNMTSPNGSKFVGASFVVIYEENSSCEDNFSYEFVQKQLGKFEVNKTYNICFECFFKSAGIKLKKRKLWEKFLTLERKMIEKVSNFIESMVNK